MKIGDLEIEISGIQPVRAIFRGRSNHREPDAALRPVFAEILSKANGVSAVVELHFEDLEFFNSLTITSVIHFIKDLRSRRVATHISYDASHHWQKIFFDALGMLQKADGLLKITPVTP